MIEMKSKWMVAVAVASTVGLAACDGDSDLVTAPTPPPFRPVPQVAGNYTGWPFWEHQVLRASDGFMKSFTCPGSLTLTQRPGNTPGQEDLSGFVVVSNPCPPVSFDVKGTVSADGTIRFVTGGPKPPEGPCPAATTVEYTGALFESRFSARGSANVTCPEFGEHKFTYIMSAYR